MTKATLVHVPQENANDEVVEIVSWLVKPGERVAEGQALAELQGSKASFEVYAPAAGVVQYHAQAGEEIRVGAVLCTIGADGPAEGPAAATPPETGIRAAEHAGTNGTALAVTPSSKEAPVVRFSRAARALLTERGLDPAAFPGRGLVRARDVQTHLGIPVPGKKPAASAAPCPAPAAPPAAWPVLAAGVPVRAEKLSWTKRTEIKYLRSAHDNTLPSTVSVAVPTRGFRAAAAGHPQVRGLATAVVLYEVARLLRGYPVLNACYSGDTAQYYEEINVGFAVDAGQGLKVPVIRGADRKTLPQIVDEMQDLLAQYLSDELSPEALAGGTFTITDLSGEGVLGFVPRLVQGQSGILGVAAECFPAGGAHGAYQLVLTFDHQLGEGRTAARFLNDLRQRLLSYEAVLRPGEAVKAGGPELCCGECLRPHPDLRELGAHLLQAVKADGSPGLVCSMCLAGF
jgi:2-oxoglutarate dehydrogenase E2 component (dihydrolipoamide succinyltransferase)